MCAATAVMNQTLWLRQLLADLKYVQKGATEILVDNEAVSHFQQSSVSWQD